MVIDRSFSVEPLHALRKHRRDNVDLKRYSLHKKSINVLPYCLIGLYPASTPCRCRASGCGSNHTAPVICKNLEQAANPLYARAVHLSLLFSVGREIRSLQIVRDKGLDDWGDAVSACCTVYPV